jgi:hypothetical protein
VKAAYIYPIRANITEEMKNELRIYCDTNGAKVSEVIREALSEFLSKSRLQHSN